MSFPEDVVLEKVPCPLGCNEGDGLVLTGHDLLHDLPGEFTVLKCNGCGLMRTDPRPTARTIGFYYPDEYGPYIGTRVNPAKFPTGIKKFLRPLLHSLVDFNVTKLPSLKPARMLEIGCASGAFLHQMAGHGWEVEGIEYSEKAAESAAKLGYRVHVGQLESAPTLESKFDLIVGWMVLEHLHDPVGSLRKLREWAEPDAWLVLSVPNAGAKEFNLFKNRWYALQLPNHLHHFTPRTLGLVLEAGGWKLEKVHHQRLLNNALISAGYLLGDLGFTRLSNVLISAPRKFTLLAYLLYPVSLVLGMLGQTGRMTVWARISDHRPSA